MANSAAKQPIRPDSPEERARQRRIRETPLWITLLLFPLSLILRLWLLTLRMKVSERDRESIKKFSNLSLIVAFWHNRLLIAAELRRRFRAHTKMSGLVSPSRDGAILTRFFRFLGIGAVRGSTSRRGGYAMMEIVHRLSHGEDVAITPDGPCGPRYKFNPGAALVAQKTHCPVALVGSKFYCAYRVKSWDGFFIPLPFSKVELRLKFLPYEKSWDHVSPQALSEYFGRELSELCED